MATMSKPAHDLGQVARTLLRPELALVVLMAVIIGMLIVPLPTFLVDLLIGVNLLIAIVIFLSSFYVERILNFSTFPSVLLFTTLMRLALSVSTSRLILVDADAGHIVSAFGEFVVADNLVVGFVIFAIVTIVQFIVITKGSERIGEVVARFSLDGMPGKQMGIDADLRAESIDAAGAKLRRREVEKESQLYGSYDGAMKFVKGDAIAGIVIVFVNLFGGIAVGMLQHGMSFQEATRVFTLLTIGDGLVAQIPALLICISAGFVVTRVGGDEGNLGSSIIKELFSSQKVLFITGLLLLLLGLLPGFPLLIFVTLAAALFALAAWRVRADDASSQQATDSAGRAIGHDGKPLPPGPAGQLANESKQVNETVPLLLLLPPAHYAKWRNAGLERQLREDLHLRMGMQLPYMLMREHDDGNHRVVVMINEITAASADIVLDHVRVLADTDELAMLDSAIELPGVDGGPSRYWMPATMQDQLHAMGMGTRNDQQELQQLVHESLMRNIGELFGIQETKHLLDDTEKRFPELLKEVHRHIPVQRVSEVLQRLQREGVSIRNMKIILETLAQWGQREKDVILLVEHVRGGLARYISSQHARNGRIAAVLLAPETEQLVRSGIRQSQGAAFLNLDPVQSEQLLDRIAIVFEPLLASRPEALLLVAPDVRRFVKRFIETRLPGLAVLSFSEISDAVSLDVVRSL
ncbi:type III secretion protein V [Stenotrophomonas maltophilia]|uniref:EscV/YscV/HrcV family type III secretion system export apparatus protein n=1 Tax=Stenotrophomonas chelatiphaga TaxID=517011 RepID=UPI000FB7F252|nr:EscV/YscV/HrcV family type III secretion system export apparatus protein [Stenotrophomonas chelatiphaga]MCS4230656.1 type III secretion protein V [Stenotrophomonas chelatiphaga]ROQ40151.1 type III secretion protein V [Stenotrophomonas maltophilia]